MVDFKHWKNDFGSVLISIAIGNNEELIDKIKYNDDGTLTIIFSVGGIELDFNKVVDVIEINLDKFITEKASTLLLNKYDGLIEEINEIKQRLENQREKIKYK